jgi:integrase
MVDPTKLLTPEEISATLSWLHHRRRRGPNFVLNRAIFRLSCCCGLRVNELCALDVGDVLTRLRAMLLVSGSCKRVVPIDWDEGMVTDIVAYKEMRLAQLGEGDHRDAPFLAGVSQNAGKRLTTDLAAKRWRSVMRVVLGEERAKQLSLQSGRRTYPSYAAAQGRSLAEITKALGNTSPRTARQYLKVAG